jgi:uncharacterized flavoprotein (TIGR03862 family)
MIAVVGGGPAGMIAAETLARAGRTVTLFDRMPSLGRKFLMAGRGGLNLTHTEPLDAFLSRYGAAHERLGPMIKRFPPDTLRAWAEDLGQECFVGSSGRVFPKSFKASPLLRAWLRRLESLGVQVKLRHDWRGWSDTGTLRFDSPKGAVEIQPEATILALGGASWPRLGADGTWRDFLITRGVPVHPFKPANCGFKVDWSPLMVERFARSPVKPLGLSFQGKALRGEAMITAGGIEGGGIYALSADLRDTIERGGAAELRLDLVPDRSLEDATARLAQPRRAQSLTNFLKRQLNLSPVAIALVHEAQRHPPEDPNALARLIKATPVRLVGTQAIDRAISSAGGVALEALTEDLMIRTSPGVFVAGEMLDWEAPTGGYLLQACFATGVAAAEGALAWLTSRA